MPPKTNAFWQPPAYIPTRQSAGPRSATASRRYSAKSLRWAKWASTTTEISRSPKTDRAAFSAQLELAKEHDLAAVVHCRDAFGDVHDHLARIDLGAKAILHCWTGGPRWTKRFLELGVTFSFAGPVAFETGDTVRRGAALVPPERAMVETDTPYLTPPPFRGQINEPAHVALNGAALAEVWGLDIESVAAATSRRAAAVFAR